ncbi:MAG: hypothetical protein ACI8UO_000977 [Verrucomicrobiales bacterium]|jgi:hypothetical protein
MFGFGDNDDREQQRPKYDKDSDDRQQDGPLHTEKIVADRKIFFLDLKENNRGRFVKITEDVRGRRDTIMVPAETLADFIDALTAIQDAEEDLD